jgi:aminopeptidase N
VHEYAHQWFGDDVTCGSWEDIWLNEGFATFFEWLSTERTQNEAWRTSLSSLVKGLTAQPGGSVLCDDTSSASRIFDGRLTYGKGAFLLRMLQYKLGEKNFYAALRNYLKDPNLQGGFAKTPQLKAHLESASGQNLTRFFDQWYYKQGHPSYKVKWLQTGTVLSTTITQTQSHPSVSFFEMPVPINFQGLEGDSTIVFDHRFSGQVFNIDMPFKVTQAFFDPEFHLLAANNQISTIYDLQKANIKLYPNPINTNFILEGFPAGTILEKLEIFNALSLLVYKRQNTIIINDVLPVDVENLEQGVYLLRATTNLGSVVLRFLKN